MARRYGMNIAVNPQDPPDPPDPPLPPEADAPITGGPVPITEPGAPSPTGGGGGDSSDQDADMLPPDVIGDIPPPPVPAPPPISGPGVAGIPGTEGSTFARPGMAGARPFRTSAFSSRPPRFGPGVPTLGGGSNNVSGLGGEEGLGITPEEAAELLERLAAGGR